MDASTQLTEQQAARRSRTIALIVAASAFMQNLDATVIVTALPALADAFHVGPSDMSVGITAYMLALAAVLPLSGWLADRFGARNVFAAAVAVFTAASVLCAAAQGLTSFTAARVLQGMGGALMGSVGRLVVVRNTDNKNMLNAVALMVWPALAAPIIGPALGGLIVTHGSWPWIFLINIPIGVAGVFLILAFVPKGAHSDPARFDALGLGMASSAMVALVAGLELIAHSPTPAVPMALTIGGLLLGWASYRRFKRHPHPLIPLDALKVRSFTAASLWGGGPHRMAVNATPFLLPLMFQVAFGWSPVKSGLLLLGYFAGNLGIKPFTPQILRRFGLRTTMLWTSSFSAAGVATCCLFGATTPDWAIFAVLAFAGAARSMQFTSLDAMTYCEIPQSMRTGASTLWGVTNQLGAVLGVAFGALAINLSRDVRGAETLALVDFQVAFFALALISLVSLPVFGSLDRDVGADVTGNRPN